MLFNFISDNEVNIDYIKLNRNITLSSNNSNDTDIKEETSFNRKF